jgi:hypothetical protein
MALQVWIGTVWRAEIVTSEDHVTRYLHLPIYGDAGF